MTVIDINKISISRLEKAYEVMPNGCWNWILRIDKAGYGRITIGKRRGVNAHRVFYAVYVGDLVEKMTIDHLCRNRRCVNPSHLEQVSSKENILRGEGYSAKNARKTHCKNGHPFEGENLSRIGNRRVCRACDRAAHARQKLRRSMV